MTDKWRFGEWAQSEPLTRPAVRILVPVADLARDITNEVSVESEALAPNPLDGTRLWPDSQKENA